LSTVVKLNARFLKSKPIRMKNGAGRIT